MTRGMGICASGIVRFGSRRGRFATASLVRGIGGPMGHGAIRRIFGRCVRRLRSTGHLHCTSVCGYAVRSLVGFGGRLSVPFSSVSAV